MVGISGREYPSSRLVGGESPAASDGRFNFLCSASRSCDFANGIGCASLEPFCSNGSNRHAEHFELRKALRDGRSRQEAPEYIATVPKRGYQLVAGAELLRCAQEEELAQDSDISADTSDIAAEASEAAVAGQRKSGKKRSKFIDFARSFLLDEVELGFKKYPY